MTAPVPPTFGMDPTRPRSADFFQSPGYRGRIGGEGPSAPPTGLPPQLGGYYPGTSAHFEAGQATGGSYGQVRDWSIAFLKDYGAPEADLEYLNGLDWNQGSSVLIARDGLERILNICEIPFGSGAPGVPASVGALIEGNPWNADMRSQVDNLITMYCPTFSLAPEPEPVTTTAQVVSDTTAPAPTPVSAIVPSKPTDQPKWGFVLGATLIGAVLVGGAWYLSKKKKPRKKNPKSQVNATMLEHTYEHGFAEGFDAAERAFAGKLENPCACQNPSKPKKKSSKKRKPRRSNEYGGTGGFPSVQPGTFPEFTRTPVLAVGTPGAGYAVPPGWFDPHAVEVLPNPNGRKKKARRPNPTKAEIQEEVEISIDGFAENTMEDERSHGDQRFQELRKQWVRDLKDASDGELEGMFLELEDEGVSFDEIRAALRVMAKKQGNPWIVITEEDYEARDTGEGPWKTLEAAEDFAMAEVGLPWLPVEVSKQYAKDREAIRKAARGPFRNDNPARLTGYDPGTPHKPIMLASFNGDTSARLHHAGRDQILIGVGDDPHLLRSGEWTPGRGVVFPEYKIEASEVAEWGPLSDFNEAAEKYYAELRKRHGIPKGKPLPEPWKLPKKGKRRKKNAAPGDAEFSAIAIRMARQLEEGPHLEDFAVQWQIPRAMARKVMADYAIYGPGGPEFTQSVQDVLFFWKPEHHHKAGLPKKKAPRAPLRTPIKPKTRKKKARKSNPLPKGAACGRQVGKLTAKKRKALPATAFGLPEKRAYPMPDTRHAGNAKARAATALRNRKLTRAEYDRIVRKANRVLKACGKR